MADPRGESNSYGGYANKSTGAGGYNNPSGGRDANDRGNGDGRAAAAAAQAAAAAETQRRNADMQAQIKAAEARKQMDEANARYEAQQAAAQAQAERLAYAKQQNALNPIRTTMGTETNGYGVNGQQVVNGIPVTDLSTMDTGGYQNPMSRADAAIMGQNFTPQLPNTAGGWMQMAGSPFSPFIQSFADQTRYGMSPASQAIFDGLDPTQKANIGSLQDQVNYARNIVKQNQAAPNSYTGPQKPSNFSDQQWNSMTQGQKQFMSPEGAFGGQAGMGNEGGGGGNMMNSFLGGQLPELNMGMGRDYQPTGGTFKPITFRSGTGNPDPYAGLSDMAQQGQGMFNVAGQDALQSADQFNYNFDPQAAGQRLFDERSSLLEPAFAQQRAKNLEQMQGLGRIGLQLSGEGLGAGEDSGMMNPDMFGMNAAQSQALAGLAAQSTQDAFGQEVQRAGLDLNQFNTNQMTDQQRYANLMGTGQGMLTASTIEPEMRNQLIAQQQQQQLLDQNYALGVGQNETARIIGQAQANQANYQPDPWLSGLTSLGSAFLGTTGGSGWLSGKFGGS